VEHQTVSRYDLSMKPILRLFAAVEITPRWNSCGL